MQSLIAAIAVTLPLVALAQDEARLDALERSVRELEVRNEALAQAQQRTAEALAAAQGTLDVAGGLEDARLERIGLLDDVIDRAVDADLAMMGGAPASDELQRLESDLMQLHGRALAESGRLESDQELAAAVSARLASEALAGGDLFTARAFLAGRATAAAGARDAAMGNAGRAWSR
jgi:hypothetical protein